MKKLIVFTMLLSLVVAFPAPILANTLDDAKDASAYCAANSDLGFSNHGKCVRFILFRYGPSSAGPIGVCNRYLQIDPDGFYDLYNSLDDCVSYLKGEVEPE